MESNEVTLISTSPIPSMTATSHDGLRSLLRGSIFAISLILFRSTPSMFVLAWRLLSMPFFISRYLRLFA